MWTGRSKACESLLTSEMLRAVVAPAARLISAACIARLVTARAVAASASARWAMAWLRRCLR